MNKHTKNQHYVPKFLLRNFSFDQGASVWAFDKKAKNNFDRAIKKRAIKKVASEEYFYDKITSNKESSYEYFFEKFETKSSLLINKIIASKSLEEINVEERRALSEFLALQILRTKGKLLLTKSFIEDFSNTIRQRTNFEVPEIDHKEVWFSMFDKFEFFSELIMKKVWVLGESEKMFLISDNPVVLQNTINNSAIRGTLGIDCYGIEIYLPLSPSIILCMYCDKLFSSKGYINNYFPNQNFESDNIKNVNALQILNAERFIFSQNNDFDFVMEVNNNKQI